MAPEAVTGERVYRMLRNHLIAPDLAPGTPIALRAMADLCLTSVAPVRDGLQRLVGEGLIELRPGGGFAIPDPSVADLADLYRWQGMLVDLALSLARQNLAIPSMAMAGRAIDRRGPRRIALLATELFAQLARHCGQKELVIALGQSNDRLLRFRPFEGAFAELREELKVLWAALRKDEAETRRELARCYHDARIMNVAAVHASAARYPSWAG